MEITLLATAPVVFAILVAWVFPRFSRNFLGPAIIVISLVAAVIIENQSNPGRDPWGLASALMAVFVGGVGVFAGLILLCLGALLCRVPGSASTSLQPYSQAEPYRVPGPGLFTPKRLFVAFIAISIFAAVAIGIYSLTS